MAAKSIFITGGASGIGRAVAQLFAARGWFVGIADINEAAMAETAALLPPAQVSCHRLDVRDRAGWDTALAAFARAAGGQIAVVHNNAGIGFGGKLADVRADEIDRAIDINFRGAVHGAQAAYPWLKAAGPGSCLLSTASASALYGTGGLAVYSATKFAVRALTEALDCEWQADGIKVRSIMPSFIDTPLLQQRPHEGANHTIRQAVQASGMEFTPVEDVAQAAWDAVHGARLHTLVGKSARQIGFAARWMPHLMRRRAQRLMKSR